MASHPYRFTVERADGRDVLVYEGQVQRVGRVRVQVDAGQVQLVYDGTDSADPSAVAPVVLATAKDPGPDEELVLRRVALNRQKPGKPVSKRVRR